MEVVDLLHVAEDDVLLVGDAWRNLLHAAGHLPQVGLTGRERERERVRHSAQTKSHSRGLIGVFCFSLPPDTHGDL